MELIVAPMPNPRILAWARQESGHAADRVAARLRVDAGRLRAWETGARQPTLRQVGQLARFYKAEPPGLVPGSG
jgi:DNA-binding transcriptional regulator YiaG